MIRLSDLPIDTKALGESFILTRISPDYNYIDGHRTSERIGTKYEVAVQDLGLEKISVKIEGEQAIPEEVLETKDMVHVLFDDLVAHFYTLNDNLVRITAKANNIHLKDKAKAAPQKDTALKK